MPRDRQDGRVTVLVIVTMSLLVGIMGGGATYATFSDTGSVDVSFEVGELPETPAEEETPDQGESPDEEEKPADEGSSVDGVDNSGEEQSNSDEQDSGSDGEKTTESQSRHFW